MEDSANKQKKYAALGLLQTNPGIHIQGNMVTSILQMKYTIKYLLENIRWKPAKCKSFLGTYASYMDQEELFRATPTVVRVLLKRGAKIEW